MQPSHCTWEGCARPRAGHAESSTRGRSTEMASTGQHGRPGGTVSYLLRLVVPDRPGILGAVATALGAAGIDIVSLDVLERAGGVAVDDIVVDLPPDRLPGSLITAGAAGAGGAGGGPGAVAGAP